MRRTLTWLVTMPFAAASVLVGHALAYRLTGAPVDDLHGYLAHAPQLVAILGTLALVGLAGDGRSRTMSPAPVASLAVGAFVCQEHLERLIHTGQLPFLLGSPTLWIGIALQVPIAIVVWLVVSALAEQIATPVRRARSPLTTPLDLILPAKRERGPVVSLAAFAHSGRGPPARL